MAYTTVNFKTKKALKDAVKAGIAASTAMVKKSAPRCVVQGTGGKHAGAVKVTALGPMCGSHQEFYAADISAASQ